MHIGILGTGNVAQTLGRRWSAAGHQITYGSRDPASAGDLGAPVISSADAVTGSEVGDEESLYQVEVTKADGSQVDVQLDENFIVVGSKTDGPGADNEPDGPGN